MCLLSYERNAFGLRIEIIRLAYANESLYSIIKNYADVKFHSLLSVHHRRYYLRCTDSAICAVQIVLSVLDR